MDFIAQPFVFLLHQLYEVTGNLGWAIIALTLLIRAATVPLTLPSLKSQKRMRALQPEIKRLRALHDGNPAAFGQAQMALYKEHNINPLAGCLPTLIQIGILFVLYHVLRQFIGEGQQGLIENINFYGLNLTAPDKTYVLPILAGGMQLILSAMLLPGLESHDIYPEKSESKEVSEANKKETQQQDMAEMMQKQMLFVFPVMTGIMAASFPAGLGLYWTVSTAFSLIQQYLISGWGGLARFLPANLRGNKGSPLASTPVSRSETIEKIADRPQTEQGSADDFAAAFAKIATGKASSKVRPTVEDAVIVSSRKNASSQKKSSSKAKSNRKKQRTKKRRK
jgi:YidC/Oxa1 family membrane protein insertase